MHLRFRLNLGKSTIFLSLCRLFKWATFFGVLGHYLKALNQITTLRLSKSVIHTLLSECFFQSLISSSLSESDFSQMFLKDSLSDNNENVFDVLGVGGTCEMVVHTLLFFSAIHLKPIFWNKSSICTCVWPEENTV